MHYFQRGYQRFIEAQQVRLSSSFDGLPLLSILALICGLVSGGLIVLFRLVMQAIADQTMPGGNIEGFEDLPALTRLLLCVAGGLLVGLILHLIKPSARSVGVLHVMERLDYHQAHLPLKNAIVQFVAASISLLSGHSVGREGPSIHLGATGGSALGRALRIPNNSTRILVACGVAAAIAAAFNTPLAGVIFAMEVVLMDYSVIGFTPVIISAVSATTLTRIMFGDDSALSVPSLDLFSVKELPIVALMGASIGCVAAAFIHITLLITSISNTHVIWKRTLLAGLVTGLIAMLIPQVMGTGYDTINHVLLGQIGLLGVILLTIAKVLATSTAIGMGVPAGLIGPTLFIGATAGSAFGVISADLIGLSESAGYYAMLGMAAMMAATLQAPLAALIFLLELSASHNIILPGMTAVISASLISSVVFKKNSIYRHLLLSKGMDHRNSSMSIALRRVGVASLMERNFVLQHRLITKTQALELIKREPRWILLDCDNEVEKSFLPATDLARFLNELDAKRGQSENQEEAELDLLKIPAMRLQTQCIPITATLQEAYETMHSAACDVLYITGAHGNSKQRVYGVITREHIESSYQN